jgi:hypothetical protein
MIADMPAVLETTPESSVGITENRNAAGNRRGMSPASQANLRRGEQVEGAPVENHGSSGADGGIAQQLRDMQHAYSRPASEDRTPGQKTCRKWMKSDLTKFMACKNRLEEKFPKSNETGDEYVRLKLDSRRVDPSFNQGDAVSLVIGVGEGDEAIELLLSTDEYLRYRSRAISDGFPLWEWIRSTMNAS